jgi:hypothetical protein
MAAAVEDSRTERVMASYRRLPSLAVNPDTSSRFAASTDDPDSFTNGASPLNGVARPSQTSNAASAPARPNPSALWPISSSDSSVSTALMTAVEAQQPGYLSHSDAAAAPVDRFPYRQTLVVSHRPQGLSSPPLSIPDQSIAFTECGQHRDRQSFEPAFPVGPFFTSIAWASNAERRAACLTNC